MQRDASQVGFHVKSVHFCWNPKKAHVMRMYLESRATLTLKAKWGSIIVLIKIAIGGRLNKQAKIISTAFISVCKIC